MSAPIDPGPRRNPLGALVVTIVLFLAMVLGGTLLYSSALNRQAGARLELERQTARLREARDNLRLLPQHLARLQTAQPQFECMARRDFVGDGNRLDWVSALARVGRGTDPGVADDSEQGINPPGIDSLSWQLQPRRPHAALPGLWVTPMTLRLAPVSAAGLGELLRRLSDEARGQFSVDSCQLNLHDPAAPTPTGQAECQLSWWNWRGAGDAKQGTDAQNH